MFKNTQSFSSFSVDDLQKAKGFYEKTLGLEVIESPQGLELHMVDGAKIFIYPKSNHTPATFTVLNFVIDNIDQTVDELVQKGVVFEHYEGQMSTDEKGIMRSDSPEHGPDIAWFKDPAGNIISVMEK